MRHFVQQLFIKHNRIYNMLLTKEATDKELKLLNQIYPLQLKQKFNKINVQGNN